MERISGLSFWGMSCEEARTFFEVEVKPPCVVSAALPNEKELNSEILGHSNLPRCVSVAIN